MNNLKRIRHQMLTLLILILLGSSLFFISGVYSIKKNQLLGGPIRAYIFLTTAFAILTGCSIYKYIIPSSHSPIIGLLIIIALILLITAGIWLLKHRIKITSDGNR